MCVLLSSGETRNYINIQKERSRLWDRSDLHEERDSLQNEIELLAHARDNEQRIEAKKTLKKRLDTSRRKLHSNQECISRLEELLGLEQSQEPPMGQGRFDVIIEETTKMTVGTADEAERGAQLGTLTHPKGRRSRIWKPRVLAAR